MSTSALCIREVCLDGWSGESSGKQTRFRLVRSSPRILTRRFVPASEEIIRAAQRLLSEYEVAPRDAIHAASAVSKGVDALVWDDSDLDVLREIRREGSSSFGERETS